MKTDPRFAPPRIRTGEISGSYRRAPRTTPTISSPPQRVGTNSVRTRRSELPRPLVVGRVLRGLGLVAIAGLSALGVVQVAQWFEGSRALPIKQLNVRGADGQLAQEVLAYASLTEGEPLLAVDLDEVAQRVLEHPYVARASVRRVPPDGVEILVERRTPRALVALDTGLYLVDEQGELFKRARAGDGLDLPVISGVAREEISARDANSTLMQVLKLARSHDAAGAPGGALAEVAVIPAIGFELVLEDGTRVRLGRQHLDEKLARLDWVVRRLSEEGRRAERIDLDDDRRPERAAVRLRPAAETQPIGG